MRFLSGLLVVNFWVSILTLDNILENYRQIKDHINFNFPDYLFLVSIAGLSYYLYQYFMKVLKK